MGCLTRRPALRAGGTLRAGAGGSDKLGSGAALHDGGAHESDGTTRVPEDQPRVEAEDAVAGAFELGGAALIGSAFESVAAAIDLDDEADAVSEEVDDVALKDDDLTAEHDAELS